MKLLIVGAGAALLATAAHSETIYSVTVLGTFGGQMNQARAINARGDVTGTASAPGTFSGHAFLASKGKFKDLGTLGGEDEESFGNGINASRQVAGYSTVHEQGFSRHRAMLYSNGGMQELPVGGYGSEAWGINDSGLVVGHVWLDAGQRAFTFKDGVVTTLETLGGTAGAAFGTNRNGDVVGEASTTGDSEVHAYVFKAGVMIDIGTLKGGSFSSGRAINDQGHVVGIADNPKRTGTRCFLWRHGKMTDLGTLGGEVCYAFGINKADVVVGSSTIPDGSARLGFVYSKGVMTLLNSLLDPVTGAGWDIFDATAINDKGQIAAIGYDHVGRTSRPLLLTPMSGTGAR